MPKRTSVVLAARHEKAINRVMAEQEIATQTDAVVFLLDKAIEYMKHENLLDVVNLKTYYYLREIAKDRGDEFVRDIEHSFAEVKDAMLENLKEGVEHVGR